LIDPSKPAPRYRRGGKQAERLLEDFVRDKLSRYPADRNAPSLGVESHMSPCLHFGQISPLQIALRIRPAANRGRENVNAYLEELLVRRELAVNFVFREPAYDSYRSLPAWARTTLNRHAKDGRETLWSLREPQEARTDDPHWNAAMREMPFTGKMHNTMRMY